MDPAPAPPPAPERPPPFKKGHGRPGLWGSALHAWQGLVHTVVHQRNMRIHVTAAFMVSMVGSGLPLGVAEKVTLIFCVLLVFFAEILNSALEHLVDLATQELNEHARIAKDAAAAGVLVLAIGTVVIFAALMFHNAEVIAARTKEIAFQVAVGVPITLCGLLLMAKWRRPAWLEVGVLLLGMALLGVQSRRSESAVFTAMAFGLLVLTGAAAAERRRELRR